MSHNGEQLIPVGTVADALGVPPVKIENTARGTASWFDGSLAVTLSEAARIFETVRAEQAASDREYIERLNRQEAEVAEMQAEAQRRAAEREAAEPRRFAGVRVSVPGGEAE